MGLRSPPNPRSAESGDMENQTLNKALEYLQKGWSVIPVGKDKIPLIEWKEFQTRLVATEEVQAWWKQWPEANVGIVTGKISGITVVDVEKGGSTEGLPATYIVKTGNGGWHFYCKEAGIRNGARVRELTDIRGEGGYVVAPPSVTDYEKDGVKKGGAYELVVDSDLAEFPKALFPTQEQGERLPVNLAESVEVAVGNRNATLHRTACSFLAKYPEYQAWDSVQAINRTYKPPLPHEEVEALFNSARGFIGQNNPYSRQGGDEMPIGVASVISFLPKEISELTEEQANVNWVWEGYLAKGHLTFLSALWKVGKSTLITHLLKAIQNESEFVGFPVAATKTLIISEDSETIWARRRQDFNLEGNIYLLCRPTKIKLNYKQWIELLDKTAAFCEEKGISLVVVDTISTFWPTKDEGNNPEIDAALIPLNKLLDKGICTMLIHHFRKSQGSEGTATRGGGSIGSRADILVEVSRMDAENPNDKQRLLRSFSRFDETPPETVIELTESGYVARGTKLDVSRERKLQFVLSLLEEQPKQTIKEIRESWGEDMGRKPTVRTLYRYVEQLLEDGRVAQTGEKNEGGTKSSVSYSLRGDEMTVPTLKESHQKNELPKDIMEHLKRSKPDLFKQE